MVSVKYLLPCSCGEKLPVESSQAGQIISCPCGRSVDVPTMQGLRKLERLQETSRERQTPSLQAAALGLSLLGGIILLAGGVFTYRTHSYYSARLTPVDLDSMSPWETWVLWHTLSENLQLPEYSKSPYHELKKVYHEYMAVGIAIIVLGTGIMAAAAILALAGRSSQRRRIRQKEP